MFCEEIGSKVGSAVTTVLGFPKWVGYITSPGSLQKRLTEFVGRVLKELQPEIEALVAERDAALEQVKALEGEIAKLKESHKGFPADVWKAASEIWRVTKETAGLWVYRGFEVEVKGAVATVYQQNGHEAAVDEAEAQLDALVEAGKTRLFDEEIHGRAGREGKTRLWGRPVSREEEEISPEEGKLLPAKNGDNLSAERAFEIFDEARATAGVFTAQAVEYQVEENGKGRTEKRATADYAVAKILPVLRSKGEKAARTTAEQLLAKMIRDGCTEKRSSHAHEEWEAEPPADKEVTDEEPADLGLKPFEPKGLTENGHRAAYLAALDKKAKEAGETPLAAIFDEDCVIAVAQFGVQSVEEVARCKQAGKATLAAIPNWNELQTQAHRFVEEQEEARKRAEEEAKAQEFDPAAVAAQPSTAIAGLGNGYARRLAKKQVNTVEDLACSTMGDLEGTGIPKDLQAQFIAAAQQMIADATPKNSAA